MRKIVRFIVFVLISVSSFSVNAQQTVFWRAEAVNGNWENGNCAEIGNIVASQWWYPGFNPNEARNRPDCNDGSTTRHNVEIGNNIHLTMTLNTTFWGLRSLTLTNGAIANRIFNSSPDDNTRGISLTNGLYNNSNTGVTHNFNSRIGIDAASVILRTNTSGAITNFNREIFGNANAIVFDGSGTTNVTATISGSGATVSKLGTGTLALSGANTYTGATTVNSGTLSLNAPTAGTNDRIPGNLVIAGGTVSYGTAQNEQILNSSEVTLSSGTFNLSNRRETIGSLNMNGGNLIRGNEWLVLSSPSSFLGGTVTYEFTSARITTAGLTTLGNVVFNSTSGSTVDFALNLGGDILTADSSTPLLSNSGGGTPQINLAGTRTFTIGNASILTIDWQIRSGSLIKAGPGVLLLNRDNVYTGSTTISAGILRIGAAERIADASNFILSGGTFSTGATTGFTETVGTLNLQANSEIALGTGVHQLNFAASNGVMWNTSSTLIITGWAGTPGSTGTAGRIVVGSLSSHLTAAQLNQIEFSGFGKAMLLSNGELVPRNPQLTVTVPETLLLPFATPQGGASASQSFNVSGTFLNEAPEITAPSGYEVSLDNVVFASTIEVPLTANTVGTLNSTPIYLRLTGTSQGEFNGTVTINSPGIAEQTVIARGAVLTPESIFIDFDSGANWTTGSGPISSYEADHTYSQSNWFFEANRALRSTTTDIDMFSGAIGTYSWQIEDAPPAIWTATYTGVGSVNSFGFKIRRGDAGPAPVYEVTYSTDGGTSWSASLQTITNAYLFDVSQWRVFNYVLPSAVDILSGELIVRVTRTAGERLLIDDFFYDISDPCPDYLSYFRSRATGLWNDPNTWEASVDGVNGWAIPICSPTPSSAGIVVRNGHVVTINSIVSLDQFNIQNGGRLVSNTTSLTIAEDTGDDLIVQNGGILEFTGGNLPTFQNLSVRVRVQTGGILRVSSNIAGSSDALAGNGSIGRVIYEHQSIFDWNTSSAFASADQIYFPNIVDDITIPIFRVSVNTASIGANSPTTIRGRYEAIGNTTWVGQGNKIFRNGIVGSGTINTNLVGFQQIIINGLTAQLGGSGTILTNNQGINIAANTVCELTSNKVVHNGVIIIDGTLNAHDFSLQGTITTTIRLAATGRVNLTNPNGFAGATSTFAHSPVIWDINPNSTIDYRSNSNQTVTSASNYGNLIFSNSGNKRFDGNLTISGNLTIQDAAQADATTSVNVIHNGDLSISGTAGFTSGAYDNLGWITSISTNQTYTSSNGNPLRVFRFISNKNVADRIFQLSLGGTNLDVKDNFSLSYSGGAIFRDNGNTLFVGGDATLAGASNAIVLTGTLEMNGASGSPQLIESFPGEVIGTHLNHLNLVGTTTDVAFSPPTGTFTARINGDVNIIEGILRPRNNILDLRGNWSNYGNAGLDEAGSRLLFQGSTSQTITCPGGEVFNFLTTSKISGSFTLNNNVTVSGSGADIATFTTGLIPAQNIPINLNGNRLSFTGTGGGSIRMQTGQVTFTGPAGSTVEIDGSNKSFLGVSSGSCLIDDNVTLNLRIGLDCGAGGLTTVEGTLQMSNGGFIPTNPPLYANNSTLRYATTSNYGRGNEWNTVAGNIGFPFNVQVFGTNPLNMGTGATDRPIRGNLTIEQGGALNMNDMSGNLIVPGNVTIGSSTTTGTLTLSSVFNGDLLVGGNLVRNATNGIFNQGDREVEMNGSSLQSIQNIASFTFLAINNNGNTVAPNGNTTITERLRLSNGTFNPGTFDVIMANESDLWRTFAPAVISKSPIVSGTDRYNIHYRDNSFATGLEWSPVETSVADLIVEGFITTTLAESRTFNRSMFLNGSTINLGGNVLTARGRSAVGTYSGDLTMNWAGARSITGPAGSRFDITGLGETGDLFYTKRFTRNDGSSLVFGPNVEVRIGNGGCNFGFGVNYPTVLDSYVTIQGVLAVQSGGYAIGTPCYYAPNSILRFANGFDYTVQSFDLTWTQGAVTSLAPGIPYNVDVLGASTDLFMNSPRSLRNNLNIVDGRFTLTTNSGTFDIGGSWSRTGTTSAFNHNEQEVIFSGNTPQTIFTDNIGGDDGETFWILSFDGGGTKTLNEEVTVLEDLNIRGAGALVGNGQDITVGKAWINDAGTASFTEVGSTVIFNGSTAANTIEATGGEDFNNLVVNNTFGLGALNLNDNIRIGGTMTFTNGIVQTGTNEVEFKNLSSHTGADAQSYVNGVVRKTGLSNGVEFIFPIGDYVPALINQYMPAAVIPEANSANGSFTARYSHENFNNAFNSLNPRPPMQLPLVAVSTCNYWDIEQGPTAPVNARVRLYYDEASGCYEINNQSALSVARYNGSTWQDRGQTAVTTTYVESGTVTAFSPFTIGSSGPGNILPITLISFTARAIDNEIVATHWVTASEVNNDYFTVERSTDAQTWEPVGTVQGAGNSTTTLNYTFIDQAPLSGLSYYRLKQTDFDGTATYSHIEAVMINPLNDGGFALHNVFRTGQALDFVYTSTAAYLTVEVFDISGRLVHGSLMENYEGQNRSSIDVNLSRGVYLLRLSDGQKSESKRFFY